MKDIRLLWLYSKGYRRHFLLLAAAVCAQAYFEIRIPQIMSDVLTGLSRSESIQVTVGHCLMIAVFSVFLALTGNIEGYSVSVWAAGVTRNLSDSLFRRMISFESRDASHFSSASTITRLTTDMNNLRHALQMVGSLLLCPLLILFTQIAALRLHPGLSLAFFMSLPVFALILAVIVYRSRVHYRKMMRQYDEMNCELGEDIQGMRTIKSFAGEDRRQSAFVRTVRALRSESLSAEKLAAMNNPISKMAVNLSVLALVWMGGLQVVSGGIEVGDLFCLITYTNQILAQVLIISMILVPLISSRVSLARIWEMLLWGTPKEESTAEETGEQVLSGSISFRNVSFSYTNRDHAEPLLGNLNFEIGNGEFVGIVGPSASGKTTLLKLMMGLYAPDSGSVQIGGRDLNVYGRKALRDAFGYVPQKPQLFSGTVEENLRAGRQDVSAEEMAEACRNACIDDQIAAMPEQYGSLILEDGSNLSGGQKQRLSLARALVRRPRILVMDNMTSALDKITEKEVCRNLKEQYAHITRVVVSDRLSAVRDADRILVLDRGRLVGSGTNEQLIRDCPLYCEMVQTQNRSVPDD